MQSLFSALSTFLELFKSLRDEISRYQRKKKTREQLFDALSTEIRTCSNLLDELVTVGETRLFTLLLSFTYAPVTSKINAVVECVTDIQFKYSEMLKALIRLAQGCREVSLNKAFMEHLIESSGLLHDFVLRMSETIKGEDSMVIGKNFYRFFKLYERELFKEIEVGDVDKVVKEYRIYVDIAKNKVKPSIRMPLIRRKTLRRFSESYRELEKVSKKVRMHKTTLVNMRDYVPSKLLPIAVLIDETLPLK